MALKPGTDPEVENFGGWSAWHEEAPGAEVLHVRGEIDIAAAPRFRRTLTDLAAQANHVIVDLGEVEYFDLSGIRVLEDLQLLCSAAGGTLIIVASRPIIRRIFEIIQLDQTIPIRPSLQEAVEFLQRRRSQTSGQSPSA